MVANTLLRWGLQSTSGRKLRVAAGDATTGANAGDTTGAAGTGRKLHAAAPAPAVTDFRTPSVGSNTGAGRKLQDASVGGTTAGVSGRKLQDAENVGGEGVGRNIPNRRLHQADLGAEGSTAASSTVNGGLPIVSPSSRTAMAPTNMNTGRKLLDAAVVGGEGVGFNIPNRRLQQADLGAEGSTAASSTSNGGLPMVSPSSQTAMAPSTNMNSGRKLLDASVSDSSTVPGAGFVSGRNVLDAAVSDTSSGACTAIG